MDKVIEVKHIYKTYGNGETLVEALKDINFDIKRGEFVGIMGPSGSGKSTLMNIIGLLDIATKGEMIIDGVNPKGASEKELAHLRGRKVGFIFQQFNLLSRLNAIENVALPLMYAGVSKKEREERAMVALQKVGLEKRMKHKPNELSGGQKQRVAIARSLVSNPAIILADEPTGALDSQTGIEVMEILKNLNKDGATVVIVTHDEKIGLSLPRLIRILDGKAYI